MFKTHFEAVAKTMQEYLCLQDALLAGRHDAVRAWAVAEAIRDFVKLFRELADLERQLRQNHP